MSTTSTTNSATFAFGDSALALSIGKVKAATEALATALTKAPIGLG